VATWPMCKLIICCCLFCYIHNVFHFSSFHENVARWIGLCFVYLLSQLMKWKNYFWENGNPKIMEKSSRCECTCSFRQDLFKLHFRRDCLFLCFLGLRFETSSDSKIGLTFFLAWFELACKHVPSGTKREKGCEKDVFHNLRQGKNCS
jgi:hypothetical protein